MEPRNVQRNVEWDIEEEPDVPTLQFLSKTHQKAASVEAATYMCI